MDDEHYSPACTQCGSEGTYMGDLGYLSHYRCHACGWVYSAREALDHDENMERETR